MRTEVLTRHEQLFALEQEWWDLWERSPDATPFQSPGWMLSWTKCFAPTAPLRIVTVRDARLRAVLPLYLSTRGGRPTALALGAGVSDYIDAVCDPERAEALEAVAAALHALSDEIGAVELPDVPQRSPLLRLLAGSARARLTPAGVCPELELASEAGALERLPRWLRRNLRRGQAGLARRGRLEWRESDRASVAPLLDGLFELHGRRWQDIGQPGVFAEAAIRRFHYTAAPSLGERGVLRVFGLYLNGECVGAILTLWRRPKVFLYAMGFRPELRSFSVGSLLLAGVIRTAARAGSSGCDFLRGAEAYKYDWGAVDRAIHHVVISKRAA